MAVVERASGAPRRSGVRRFLWLVLQATAICGWLELRSTLADAGNRGTAKAVAAEKQDIEADKPDPAKQSHGYFLRIELPISGDLDTKIRASVTRMLGTLPAGGPRPVIVFELWPGQTD